MPRLPRVYIEGILYYVTSRSTHSQGLFLDPNDYHEYISLLDKYKRQYGFKLFSYGLMATHLHMLIELRNNIHISNIMHDINSLYTKIFNNRYQKQGHLFQGRFNALLAEKKPYLLPLARHIHLHPRRAKIVDDPKDYPYSSHQHYLDPKKRQYPDMREEIEEVFGLLQGREEAFDGYVTGADQKEVSDFRKRLHKKRILGSKEFTEEIKKTMEEAAEQQKRTPLPRRLRLVLLAAGSAVILFFAMISGFFYRQSATLKSEYDKTLRLYKRTLAMLEKEKVEAIQSEEDVDYYDWKIGLTEKALKEVEQERAEAIKARKEIEGYKWKITLRQIGGPRRAFADTDTISFKDNKVESANLKRKGFSSSTYSKRELRNDNIVWETMQTNDNGDTASWRGEWNGETMKGIVSRRSRKGTTGDFSFVSTGERIENKEVKDYINTMVKNHGVQQERR